MGTLSFRFKIYQEKGVCIVGLKCRFQEDKVTIYREKSVKGGSTGKTGKWIGVFFIMIDD